MDNSTDTTFWSFESSMMANFQSIPLQTCLGQISPPGGLIVDLHVCYKKKSIFWIMANFCIIFCWYANQEDHLWLFLAASALFSIFSLLNFLIRQERVQIKISVVIVENTNLFFHILSIVFFVNIRFWNIIFHAKGMISYLNRQTLKWKKIHIKLRGYQSFTKSWRKSMQISRQTPQLPATIIYSEVQTTNNKVFINKQQNFTVYCMSHK